MADLVDRKVDVIVANQASSAAVMAATKTIPFVFVVGGDPIKLGLVSSMSRPGGNVTGLTFLQETVAPKQLEIVRELVPQTTAIALLVHPASTGAEIVLKDLQNAARIMGLQLSSASVNSEGDFEGASRV